MSNHNPLPTSLPVGAWVWKVNHDGPARKVTYLRHDNHGYVEYAEGWVDVRASDEFNFSLSNPEA